MSARAALLALACASAWASAQGYPDRPVRLIVPQAAGSATDTVARLLAADMQGPLGQPVVVEDRPGGALTIGLRNPERFRSVSAFSPIVSPLDCPWGEKALTGYLGTDQAAWREYDACALIEDGARFSDLLVDYGDADSFLAEQLRPELLQAACAKANIPLTLRRQAGYDHSYYFISTFMDDHLRWHAARLRA